MEGLRSVGSVLPGLGLLLAGWMLALGGPAAAPAPGISAARAPTQGTLVFQSDRAGNGNWDVYTVAADGSHLKRLTDSPEADRSPAWSPDGRFIAFSSDRTGGGDLYLMDVDGHNLRRLTDHPAYEGAPRFSPDGRFLAFEGERDGKAEIYRLTLANGKVERLTNSIWRKLGPVYSPDGRSIAFMEKGFIRWHLSLLDLASGEVREMSDGALTGSCRPAFSPDGRLLAYVGTRDSPKADIWLREMEGPRQGEAWRLPTLKDAYNYDPAFSPDGMALAFSSTRNRGDSENWRLFVVDLNGRNPVPVTNGEGSDRFPEWRPLVRARARETF